MSLCNVPFHYGERNSRGNARRTGRKRDWIDGLRCLVERKMYRHRAKVDASFKKRLSIRDAVSFIIPLRDARRNHESENSRVTGELGLRDLFGRRIFAARSIRLHGKRAEKLVSRGLCGRNDRVLLRRRVFFNSTINLQTIRSSRDRKPNRSHNAHDDFSTI